MENFVIDTIKGIIVLVISNRPRASRSSDFEITRAITPSIVIHSVQLLLLRGQFSKPAALKAVINMAGMQWGV